MAAGFVLAGGQSTRMGRDKALLPFAGKPLIEHAMRTLQDAGISAAIVGNRPDLAAFGSIIPDEETGRGPLQGVCRALSSTHAEVAVLVSVDAPLLPPALLSCMLLHARITGRLVTLPSVGGFTQTFPCVLRRRILPVLQRELDEGSAGCFAAFRAAAEQATEPLSIVSLELIAQAGLVQHPLHIPPAFWLFNMNTREDLLFAERCAPGVNHVI